MASDQIKVLLNYIKDVLGIDSFAPPTSAMFPPTAPQIRTKPILFVATYSESASPELLEMQKKMVAALKLNLENVEFLNVRQTKVEVADLTAASIVIVFGSDTLESFSGNELHPGEIKNIGGQKVLLTHSLSDLAKSPALKKETWTHLQSVF